MPLPSELVWLKICYLNNFKMGFATLWMTYIVRERAKKNMISGLLIKSDISWKCLCITYCKVHICYEKAKKATLDLTEMNFHLKIWVDNLLQKLWQRESLRWQKHTNPLQLQIGVGILVCQIFWDFCGLLRMYELYVFEI